MLFKLQKKTLILTQVIGYALCLFIGTAILLITIQLYNDTLPLLQKKSDVLKSDFAVVSKKISAFKSMNKEKVYFTDAEIKELENSSFSKSVSSFNNATFKVRAYTKESESIPLFYTDLFFESIPNEYLDVKPDDWRWVDSIEFIPIIIPEDYLNLYNFGFAESQGLPVLSKSTISQIRFMIKISGNDKSQVYQSKIVGFSNKINSILVPEDFLLWANGEFGKSEKNRTSRVLVEFEDPSDENILKYFNENNYAINEDKLEFSKLSFFFKSALFFIFFIALLIVLLSIAFILMSINLIIQKNKELFSNLYHIGYGYLKIARFYQIVISSITLLSIILAAYSSNLIRNLYINKFEELFLFAKEENNIYVVGIIVTLLLLLLYNILLIKNIKRAVIPKKSQ